MPYTWFKECNGWMVTALMNRNQIKQQLAEQGVRSVELLLKHFEACEDYKSVKLIEEVLEAHYTALRKAENLNPNQTRIG